MWLRLVRVVTFLVIAITAACGPSSGGRECNGDTDLRSDPDHCGSCGNACGDGNACINSRCVLGSCQPGAVEDCYDGQEGTLGVGPCAGGTRTCDPSGVWGRCENQVLPIGEVCGDSIDNNCNGMVDEDIDADGDGFTTCQGDCCDSTECTRPELVNPGAYDAIGNNLDDDCNGVIDDTVLLCDQNINSNTTDGFEFARAIDLCQRATAQDLKWGVIDAKVTLTDGTGTPDKNAYSVRTKFGNGVTPQGGLSLALISTGGAAAPGDTNPSYQPWISYTHTTPNTAPYPADWFAANNNKLPNAPGCSAPSSTTPAQDPVMLTFEIRVPTNARSFRLSTNFFSAEFPEYTCSTFNDFFVVLLDSTYTGANPNPPDKNLAFFQPMNSNDHVPVGVNLAHGNTGLFTQCTNGPTGCFGTAGNITTCTSTAQLAGTGFDALGTSCSAPHTLGGGTGWLVTSGNVVPGEVIKLRIAIWDTSDHRLDSIAVIDGFQWSTELAQPGTVIN
ncbi:MAG: choice-of-anchor L domain-containing protein [Kofleriaceae bacterium]